MEVLRLHSILKTQYGSGCQQNLNRLTTLLKSLAFCSTGLAFLLECRELNVFPVFIARSVNFARLGCHLKRLAERLPRRILRAATRDLRSRQASLQEDVDSVWLVLYGQVTDVNLWNAIVTQKDSYYHRIYNQSLSRLQNKLNLLTAKQLNNDYYKNATLVP